MYKSGVPSPFMFSDLKVPDAKNMYTRHEHSVCIDDELQASFKCTDRRTEENRPTSNLALNNIPPRSFDGGINIYNNKIPIAWRALREMQTCL